MDMDDVPTETAPSSLWPLASSPERARWAAQAIERYRHMAPIIMSRAAAWPAPTAPFLPQARTSRGRSTRRSKPEVRADLERRELDVHPVVMDYLARGRAAEEALHGR